MPRFFFFHCNLPIAISQSMQHVRRQKIKKHILCTPTHAPPCTSTWYLTIQVFIPSLLLSRFTVLFPCISSRRDNARHRSRRSSSSASAKQTRYRLSAHSLPRHLHARDTHYGARFPHQRHIQLRRDPRHHSPVIARELRTRCRHCSTSPQMIRPIV